jgi:4-amino-4-deoxy-L-arabinose transferase-like glycosyltransferase
VDLSNIFGLPAHPLIVHAVVVLVPLSAVGAIAVVASAWVRSHVAWLVAAAAVLNLLLVPLATGSGESLEERVKETALVETHTEMGEQLLPWVIALAVGIVAFLALSLLASRRSSETPAPAWAARWVSIALAVVTVVAATGTLVQVARIGHSGAKASWSDVTSG